MEPAGRSRLAAGLAGLKPRAQRLDELAERAAFYVRQAPLPTSEKARKLLTPEAVERLGRLAARLAETADWREEALEALVRGFAEAEEVKLGQVAQPLRAALTGDTASPGIFEVMAVLGREETLARLPMA